MREQRRLWTGNSFPPSQLGRWNVPLRKEWSSTDRPTDRPMAHPLAVHCCSVGRGLSQVAFHSARITAGQINAQRALPLPNYQKIFSPLKGKSCSLQWGKFQSKSIILDWIIIGRNIGAMPHTGKQDLSVCNEREKQNWSIWELWEIKKGTSVSKEHGGLILLCHHRNCKKSPNHFECESDLRHQSLS